jgi:hypothetical protein
MEMETMNKLASSRCLEGLDGLTFPGILSDPLVRTVMAADHVDPQVLAADLARIAQILPSREPRDGPAGCCVVC